MNYLGYVLVESMSAETMALGVIEKINSKRNIFIEKIGFSLSPFVDFTVWYPNLTKNCKTNYMLHKTNASDFVWFKSKVQTMCQIYSIQICIL